MTESFFQRLSLSIMGGISISVACICYMRVGGLAGAVLFAFGLLAVVHYGWKLYTGVSGFIKSRGELPGLAMILFGNILGCMLTATAMRFALPGLSESAHTIFLTRIDHGWARCLVLGIGCGFIMTTAVRFARDGRYLPLLFGVPVFIMCGFLHSIADAFYLSMLPLQTLTENATEIAALYLAIVAGNFLGCNLTRIITRQPE